MEENIHNSLKSIKTKYDELNSLLELPEIANDVKKYTKITRDIKKYEEIVKKYNEYKKHEKVIKDSKEIIASETDKNIIDFAKDEISNSQSVLLHLEKELKILILPRDDDDFKNVIVEIRGATGGDEANIFAADLFRMYQKYADSINWKIKILDSQTTNSGYFSFISFQIIGDLVYSKLKFETGSHRVQRIPTTETQGRVHTSTAVVLVMPEPDEDEEIVIKKEDLRIDTYRSSGAGGQSVNRIESAVRITHLPTGIVTQSQEGKSQHSNKENAMKALKAKLYEKQMLEQEAKEGSFRKLAGQGRRSEKIRTYNFPQNRLTDHRISYSNSSLDKVMQGRLDPIFEALLAFEQVEKIKKYKI